MAAFQQRMPYDDLVRMPAREYRRRALAEMAQSRSFYVRARRRGGDRSGDESSGDEGEEEEEEEAAAAVVEGVYGGGSRRNSHDIERGGWWAARGRQASRHAGRRAGGQAGRQAGSRPVASSLECWLADLTSWVVCPATCAACGRGPCSDLTSFSWALPGSAVLQSRGATASCALEPRC